MKCSHSLLIWLSREQSLILGGKNLGQVTCLRNAYSKLHTQTTFIDMLTPKLLCMLEIRNTQFVRQAPDHSPSGWIEDDASGSCYFHLLLQSSNSLEWLEDFVLLLLAEMQGIVREKLRNIAGNMIWYEFNYPNFCTSADNCWSRTLSLRCLFKSPRWRSCQADQKLIRGMNYILKESKNYSRFKAIDVF